MKVLKHYLSNADSQAYFTAYLIDDYKEYQQGVKRPVALICPGGGFMKLSEREGEPVALTFLQKGYHAIVLHYSIATAQDVRSDIFFRALREVGITVRTLYEKEEQWHVDTSSIILVGFSAGAHLAAFYSNCWSDSEMAKTLDTVSARLKIRAVVLGYPLCDLRILSRFLTDDDSMNIEVKAFLERSIEVICKDKSPGILTLEKLSPVCQVNENTRPAFIWHTAEDEMISVENALEYALQLSRHQIPYELHVFERGVHGLALANEFTAGRPEEINSSCQEWTALMFQWLNEK